MKSWLMPLFLLAAILAASALNCHATEENVSRWQEQLEVAETESAAENWSGARAALAESYDDWSSRQTYLHIMAEHNVVDSADTMYRRCAAFAASEEPSEFRAEIADLKHQLWLLVEMERFSIKNIL
jgi:hypothetical protein